MNDNYYYTLNEIIELRDTAARIKAEMPYQISQLTVKDLQKAANGAGPDAFPSIVRHTLSALLPYADVATMIHDSEFTFITDSSKEAWEGANLRFYRNCILRNADLYGWYDPRRWLNVQRIKADYALLGGNICWNAWLAAKKKYR